MRIIAGDWRGRRLAAVGKGDPGAHLRPTTDRVRESLFSMLAGGRFDRKIQDGPALDGSSPNAPAGSGDPFDGATVLDLFAGTGALGLEALSRGADFCTFVESGRTGARLVRENLDLLNGHAYAALLTCDATRLPARPATTPPASLVFLDPPYGKGLGARAIASARAQGWLTPQALIVWEESTPQPAPEGFTLLDARRYGDTHVTLLRAP
ncbi:RsmD family RNA methyltransferase [Sagittula salina]|uniref:RsmD family RNA methyltransferase n=1 Tax=Sagittula salina TaxID=2820268 RepID=A0A940MM22_9RHOB|nr:RsmD family RNA methyltransferase [Sagittula salina]